MTKRKKLVRRYAKPSSVMTFVLFVLILAPTAFMASTEYYTAYWNYLSFEQYDEAASRAFIVGGVFSACYLGGLSMHKLAQRVAPRQFIGGSAALGRSHIRHLQIDHRQRSYLLSRHRVVYWVALFSSLLIWLIFLSGGYEKVAQYGQNIDRLDYRLIGANDSNRAVTALTQIARRLVLPFATVYFIVLRWYSNKYSLWFVLFLLLSLVIGVIMTLERGPLMLIIVMLFYAEFMRSRSIKKLFSISFILCCAIILLGGTMTYIQYNIQGFGLGDVIFTGFDFISNRAIMAPNFVPIELSYGLFDFSSEKLFLRFSRLTALITGSYVGTLQENSIYVGPVGAIADIWRNLGIVGIVLIGFILGLYFAHLDRATKTLDPAARAAATFTVISLVFYFYYGTFFSQGVFLQIFVLMAIMRFFRGDGAHPRHDSFQHPLSNQTSVHS
ncbi:O-antigen polymerase [Yoonia sp. SDW83-1]|uniref:O-antigen polymerase n=1 Tax=Yoonia sp. SDW83-1 TaxID=3366945 RepID=UPI00398C65B1